jgi:D-amino-acid dehydrogenase
MTHGLHAGSQDKHYQIIGGGLMGLCTALALLRRDVRNVSILEAREDVALETSFGNAGMQHASLAAPWNSPGVMGELIRSFVDPGSAMKLRMSAIPSHLFWGARFLWTSRAAPHAYATRHNYKLAVASIQLTQQYRRELDIDDAHTGPGLIKIFRDGAGFDESLKTTKFLQDLGLKAQILDVQGAITKEPALEYIKQDICGALYYPDDYKADSYLFCQALKTEILRLGGQIEAGVQVQNLITQRGTVVGAQTNKGDRRADMTIVCAGAYSPRVLKTASVNLPVRPVKGYSLSFKNMDQGTDAYPVLPVVDESLHAAVTPLAQQLRISGTAEITGFNKSMPASRMRPLLGLFEKIYPHLAKGVDLDDGEWWHGFRPTSADGLPFIGHTSRQGLAVNAGHGHMGWTMSSGSGALLADILLGLEPSVPAHPYRPVR